MVETSRDGRRVYFTNSLYSTWDDQFYPDGIRGWMAKLDVSPAGGMALDKDFFLEFEGTRTPSAFGGWGRLFGFLLLRGKNGTIIN